MALLMTASGSLFRKQILVDISSKLSEATAGVFFRCHVARQNNGYVSVSYFEVQCDSNIQLPRSHENAF